MRLELESNPSSVQFVETPTGDVLPFDATAEANDKLREGIRAAQAGDRAKAKAALLRSSELQPGSESTWLWLASISEYPEELLVFLNKVLDINPLNQRALDWTAATKSLLSKTFVRQGIEAAETNQPEAAQKFFADALEFDQNNESAWLWMASLSDSTEGKMAYLDKVLSINPENEAAKAAYSSARNEINLNLLSEARAAAVAGRANEANDLIDAIIAETPDSEDAWILKSHLAENFDAKIRAFDRVLEINPENQAAKAGRASLTAIMDAVVLKAPVEVEVEAKADDVPVASSHEETPEVFADPEENRLAEMEFGPHSTTGKLAFPDAIIDQDFPIVAEMDAPQVEFVEAEAPEPIIAEAHLPADEVVAEISEDFYPVEVMPDDDQSIFAQKVQMMEFEPMEATVSEPNVESSFVEVADRFDEVRTLEAEPLAEENTFEALAEVAEVSEFTESAALVEAPNSPFSDFAATYDNTPAVDTGIPMPFAEPLPSNELPPTGFETKRVTMSDMQPAQLVPCSFCSTYNESQAFICQGCMAILTLSDLEMLLANQHADKVVLRDSVEKMEREKTTRGLSEFELTMLGIGHLNLRNLQYGYQYLHEASLKNPNNIVLSRQVNALNIRLEEIKKQQEVHQQQPKGKTILVVDDSPTVRKLISGKLEKCGHEVFCSNDGIEAMERLQDLSPDLILLDITMPRMDGYQVCKMIRTNPETKDVPIVMISGKDGFFDKVRGRLAGTSGYITKPFGPETLMKAVETYLAVEKEQ